LAILQVLERIHVHAPYIETDSSPKSRNDLSISKSLQDRNRRLQPPSMRFSLFLVLTVVALAVSFFEFTCAKEEVTIKGFDEMWKGAFAKIKANPDKFKGLSTAATNENAIVKYKEAGQLAVTSAKNTNKLRGAEKLASDSTKNLEKAIVKIEAGAKFKPLDTASAKFKGDFTKLKAAGQLKNVDEKQAAKITESVTEEIVKNPSKTRNIMKAVGIAYGIGLTALIAGSLISMAP
ncbi:hypothetical protein L915_09272, partial [Phytophthora nicotianae]